LVNDGTDEGVTEIAEKFPSVKHIKMEHAGLSAARNLGAAEATGDVFAYTDDDCVADEEWLLYLAEGFAEGDYAAVGGPNISPTCDDGAGLRCGFAGWTGTCVVE